MSTCTARQAARLVGQSPATQALRRQAQLLAGCDVSVLLLGESGTGKELLARTVHEFSARAGGPFVGINCAALHETLLESELFGHEKGAFTGAGHSTLGLLRAGDGGTVLLDEIGDMPPALQGKLLRVLEEMQVIPVGGHRPVPIDIRVIAATHRDLELAVRQGQFRQDLFYRLNVVTVFIPPLRQRCQDIPPLVLHMLAHMAALLDVPERRVSPEAMAVLCGYDWPGNVRQLGNVIQRAYVLGEGPVIQLADLPPEVRQGSRAAGDAQADGLPEAARGFPPLRLAIRKHLQDALYLAGGVRTQAARMLGVDRKSLWRMIRRHNLA